jgi:hypothetical protein
MGLGGLGDYGGWTIVECGKMPRTGLAYERPSRVSQALILCFSLAVVVMAGWLVMMIMLPNDANTLAADPADVPETATVPAPRIENSVTAYNPPLANPAPSPPGAPPWPAAPSTNPFSTPPAAAPARPPDASTTSSLAPSDANYRGASNNDRFVETEPGNDAAELVPLPPPRPRRTAVPVPRPRPRIDDQADAPPPRERTFFDMLVGR